MGVNTDSIFKKAKTYMATDIGKKKNDQYMRRALLGDKTLTASGRPIYSLDRIGFLFEQCLVNEISSSNDLRYPVKDILIHSLEAYPYDYISNGKCFVTVWFNSSYAGAKPSLYPEGYPEGIDSLVALYNNGVDHIMNPVWGIWNGRRVASHTVIPRTNFVQQAVDNFYGNYAYDCNVINIEISEDLGR